MRPTMRTLKPGEVTAAEITGEQQPEPEQGMPERVAAAVTREAIAALAKGGSGRGQWAAIIALGAALAVHIVGDGTVREKVDRMERLVEWLAMRAIAEDQGRPTPDYPLL